VVPFGMTNASATFMCLMNGMIRYFLDKFVIVFLDYILIYSNVEEEHEKHLRMVLQMFTEYQLYEKLSKCTFYQNNIDYLGHVISYEGIIVYTETIEEIKIWPMPKNISKDRSFMGMVTTGHSL
jgi:hypothetical protein